MKKYNDIFFDLDNTLWDFNANSLDAIYDVYNKYQMQNQIPDFYRFIEKYHFHNNILWTKYHNRQIDKHTLTSNRFHFTFKEFNIDNKEFAENFNFEYQQQTTIKTKLIKHSIECLEYLFVNYDLHIITNGFQELQAKKIRNAGLDKYFKTITTSEEIGVLKPNIEIYDYSLKKANAHKAESIIIGDDPETDIKGAILAGWDCIWLNINGIESKHKPTFEIKSLIELKKYL